MLLVYKNSLLPVDVSMLAKYFQALKKPTVYRCLFHCRKYYILPTFLENTIPRGLETEDRPLKHLVTARYSLGTFHRQQLHFLWSGNLLRYSWVGVGESYRM